MVGLSHVNVCIFLRRERNICQICWAKTAQGDFETSGEKTAADGKVILKANCCNYGTKVDNQDTAFDCAIIPGASKGDGVMLSLDAVCGGNLGTAHDQDQATTKTVCCKFIKHIIFSVGSDTKNLKVYCVFF